VICRDVGGLWAVQGLGQAAGTLRAPPLFFFGEFLLKAGPSAILGAAPTNAVWLDVDGFVPSTAVTGFAEPGAQRWLRPLLASALVGQLSRRLQHSGANCEARWLDQVWPTYNQPWPLRICLRGLRFSTCPHDLFGNGWARGRCLGGHASAGWTAPLYADWGRSMEVFGRSPAGQRGAESAMDNARVWATTLRGDWLAAGLASVLGVLVAFGGLPPLAHGVACLVRPEGHFPGRALVDFRMHPIRSTTLAVTVKLFSEAAD